MSEEGAEPLSPAPLQVLHLDPAFAVVDKPAGLMVHDSALARGETDFAADRLRAQFGRPVFLVLPENPIGGAGKTIRLLTAEMKASGTPTREAAGT